VSDPPPLSVLLPCRDAADHLPQAISGIRMQTFRDFEVVAVNDGSADDTADLLERWAARDDRVRVVHLERVGLPAALQTGSGLCRSALLARADADDVAHPRRFAEQVEFLGSRPEVAAVGTQVRYFPWGAVGWGARRYQTSLNDLTEPEQVARDAFVECPIAHPTLMVRRDAFEKAGGYQTNAWPEDYDLVLRLHTSGARLANVPRVLHFWREGSHRMSRSDPRYAPDAFRRCKIHYLRRSLPDARDSVRLWGAGRVGKDFARALAADGIHIRGFFDIDPRRIGQEIYGALVEDAEAVTRYTDAYLLVAVGAAGARDVIREQLTAAGFEEPSDYCCVA
jgi:glycosyltransferase involved in cell wall biosynthesis